MSTTALKRSQQQLSSQFGQNDRIGTDEQQSPSMNTKRKHVRIRRTHLAGSLRGPRVADVDAAAMTVLLVGDGSPTASAAPRSKRVADFHVMKRQYPRCKQTTELATPPKELQALPTPAGARLYAKRARGSSTWNSSLPPSGWWHRQQQREGRISPSALTEAIQGPSSCLAKPTAEHRALRQESTLTVSCTPGASTCTFDCIAT